MSRVIVILLVCILQLTFSTGTSIAQAKKFGEAIEIYNGEFYQAGLGRLSNREVKRAIKTDRDALNMYRAAEVFGLLGDGFMSLGGILMLVSFEDEFAQGRYFSLPFVLASVGIGAIGYPLHSLGQKRRKAAVRLYNENLQYLEEIQNENLIQIEGLDEFLNPG